MDDIFERALDCLKGRPKRLDDVELWLFVTANTARALIDSSDKSALGDDIFSGCSTVREVREIRQPPARRQKPCIQLSVLFSGIL